MAAPLNGDTVFLIQGAQTGPSEHYNLTTYTFDGSTWTAGTTSAEIYSSSAETHFDSLTTDVTTLDLITAINANGGGNFTAAADAFNGGLVDQDLLFSSGLFFFPVGTSTTLPILRAGENTGGSSLYPERISGGSYKPMQMHFLTANDETAGKRSFFANKHSGHGIVYQLLDQNDTELFRVTTTVNNGVGLIASFDFTSVALGPNSAIAATYKTIKFGQGSMAIPPAVPALPLAGWVVAAVALTGIGTAFLGKPGHAASL